MGRNSESFVHIYPTHEVCCLIFRITTKKNKAERYVSSKAAIVGESPVTKKERARPAVPPQHISSPTCVCVCQRVRLVFYLCR